MPSQITFDEYRNQWLEDVALGTPSTTELGNRFSRKLLTQWLEVDAASDDIVYCDGANDGGIDLAYLHRREDVDVDDDSIAEGNIWYIVQSKYGAAFKGSTTLYTEAQKILDTLSGNRTRLSSLAEGLVDRLITFVQSDGHDRIVLVFATEAPLTEPQMRSLQDIEAMGRSRLGAAFSVEAVSIATIYQRTLDEVDDVSAISVAIKLPTTIADDTLWVGAIPLLAVYDFLNAFRAKTQDLDRLYEKNVRRFLGSRGRINSKIQETLSKTPQLFGLYNNGITIVVSDIRHVGNGSVELLEPYVVNGCQTTRCVWEVCNKKLNTGTTGFNAELEEWRHQASQGVVVTKIVKVGKSGKDTLANIARYTNRQNAVRDRDFISLESEFKDWEIEMARKYNLYLETQRGGWDAQRARQKQNPKFSPRFDKYANSFDLLKVYAAGWLREAGTAWNNNSAFLPSGSIFKDIVDGVTDDRPFGIDDLYAAYRLQLVADELKFGRGGKQTRRSTRYLYYMVVVELLREVHLRAGLETTPRKLTHSLLKLFCADDSEPVHCLLDTGVEIVDGYLTPNTDNNIFDEPALQNTFGGNLNAYLKWEQMGKTKDCSPQLHQLLSDYKKALSRGMRGQEAPLKLITEVLTKP